MTEVPHEDYAMETADHENLAALVDSLDSDAFPARLIDFLSGAIAFEAATIFIHRGEDAPIHVYNNFEGQRAQRGIEEFLEKTYILNPFFQAQRKGLPSGVYRIKELAPDVYFESEYYKSFRVQISDLEESGYVTRDWPVELCEIDIAARVAAGETAEIALYRHTRGREFTDRDIAALRVRNSVIVACMAAYWRRRGSFHLRPGEKRGSAAAFSHFGEGTITTRERQVLELVLGGHSSEAIGARLDISLATVKTHRKHAYEKLRISTQAELLALFLQHLGLK